MFFEHSSYFPSPSFSSNSSHGEHKEEEDDFLVYTVVPSYEPLTGSLYMCLPLLVHAVVSSMLNDKPLQFHTHALYRRLLHQWIQKQLMIFLLLFVKVIVSAFILSSFVSYNHLSSSTCSFITSLEFVSILKTVDEALSQPGL